MTNFGEYVSFIWNVADLLRGPYKPNQYGRVILPMTVSAAWIVSLNRPKKRSCARPSN